MERVIKIVFDNPDHRLFPAIYKITFGGKFYIGKANIPAERMREHENGLKKAFRTFFKMKFENITSQEYSDFLKYRKFVNYLYENPKIETGTVEIIQRGIHPVSLYYMENRHLNAVINHPDCLNSVFVSGRPRKSDTHFCDARIEKEKLLLFNPINGNNIWASSISKSYEEFKKVMNAGADKISYNNYLSAIMVSNYNEDKDYLSQQEKSERLGRIIDFKLGRNQPQN